MALRGPPAPLLAPDGVLRLAFELEMSVGGAMSDKYMKEIEEILRRAEEAKATERTSPRKRRSRPSGRFLSLLSRLPKLRIPRVSAGKLMVASVVMLLLALVLPRAGIGSVVIFVVAGLVLFVIAYALFFVRPGGIAHEKRWRGRPIEEGPPLWTRFRRWLKG